MIKVLLLMIVAYLLGSVPFGYLIVRARLGADVRETGSGGTGATNVSRRAGKLAGLFTLVLDAVKGASAVLCAAWILKQVGGVPKVEWWVGLAAMFAILGHMFPVWLRFRGGKGVATGMGIFLVVAPIALLGAAVAFLVIVWTTRYVSLGSIVAACSIPVFVILQNAFVRPVESIAAVICTALGGAALIVFAHRQNIARLIQGTENKFA